MKKKRLILPCLLVLLCGGMAHADDVYTYVYVQQKSGGKTSPVTADGTAKFCVSPQDAVLYFDAGNNAVMTKGGITVAKVTASELSSNGELAADFVSSTGAGTLLVSVKDAGYATLYSPFQLTVNANDEGISVYAPYYDSENHLIRSNESTKVADSIAIAPCTPLVLRTQGKITFAMSEARDIHDASADNLSGTSVLINKPTVSTGQAVFTLGKEKTTSVVGFYSYNGTTIRPGSAYLIANTFVKNSQNAKYVAFSLDDEYIPTAIDDVNAEVTVKRNGKYIENGKVIIVKDGRKYNLNGLEIK